MCVCVHSYFIFSLRSRTSAHHSFASAPVARQGGRAARARGTGRERLRYTTIGADLHVCRARPVALTHAMHPTRTRHSRPSVSVPRVQVLQEDGVCTASRVSRRLVRSRSRRVAALEPSLVGLETAAVGRLRSAPLLTSSTRPITLPSSSNRRKEQPLDVVPSQPVAAARLLGDSRVGLDVLYIEHLAALEHVRARSAGTQFFSRTSCRTAPRKRLEN